MMFAAGYITEELAVRVGWTLIHSLWQIALIGGLFWIVNKSLVRRSANLRYVVGCLAMVLMLVVPVCWFVFCQPVVDEATSPLVPTNPKGLVASSTTGIGASHLDQELDHWFEREFRSYPEPGGGSSGGELEESSAIGSHWIAQFVAAVWLIGVIALSLRPVLGFAHARRLCKVGRTDVPESVQVMLFRVAEAMRVRQVVCVAHSMLAQVPCVVGWFRPVILLPASALTGLSNAELESILAHELAHIRRHDYIVNLAQMAIETLLFFHPVVWWVSRCVRREREYCCDDLALQVCGDRKVMTDALLAVGGVKVRPRLALASDGSVLFERVERILEPKSNPRVASQRQRSRIAAVVCLALIGVAAGSTFLPSSESDLETKTLQQEIFMTSEPNDDKPKADDTNEVAKKSGADKRRSDKASSETQRHGDHRDVGEQPSSLSFSDSVSFVPPCLENPEEVTFLPPDHPFIVAVREDDLPRVKELIEADSSLLNAQVRGDIYLSGKIWRGDEYVDIDEDAPHRAGALHFAAFNGHSELAQLLIDLGADISIGADFGEERDSGPVGIAAWNGDAATLKVLLEAAANEGLIRRSRTRKSSGSPDGSEVLRLQLQDSSGSQQSWARVLRNSLQSALAHSARDKADLLLEYGAEHDFYTAAMAGDGETLKRLIETDPDSIDAKHSEFDGTPLEEALKVGQLEMAELLVGHGANVSIKAAAAMGRIDEIEKLLAEEPEATTRRFGKYPLLDWAIFCGQAEVVQLLLDHGADPNGFDEWRTTPLGHCALVHGDKGADVVDLLIAAGADIDQESRGATPIAIAKSHRNKRVTHRLCYHKENDVEVTEFEWKFWNAIGEGDLQTVKACLEKDSSLASKRFPTYAELTFLTNGFPLHAATAGHHWEIAKLLLDHGVDPDAKWDLEIAHEFGASEEHRELGMPIIHAYGQRNFEMVHLLLDRGASVHAHPYCAHSFASVVYRDANDAGAPTSLILRSIPNLDDEDKKKIATIPDDAAKVIKLYDRILSLGAIPAHSQIAQAGDFETVETLLRKHPDGPSEGWFGKNLHENVLFGAAWRGNAKAVEMCMDICADRHTTYAAAHCIRSAITSHNRPGSFEGYHRVIKMNLEYLKERNAFYEHDWFLPLHLLADSYIKDQVWGGELPTVEQQLQLAQLCLEKGIDVNHLTFDAKLTPLDHAIGSNQKEYAEFLRTNGGRTSEELAKE